MSSHILIVEDDRPILDLFAKIVERAGYTVTGCDNGEEALDYLREHTPDLIMLDLTLGGSFSGVDVLRYVSQTARLNQTIVVIISAHPQLPPDLYHHDRVARIIAKPARPTDIVNSLATLLKR